MQSCPPNRQPPDDVAPRKQNPALPLYPMGGGAWERQMLEILLDRLHSSPPCSFNGRRFATLGELGDYLRARGELDPRLI